MKTENENKKLEQELVEFIRNARQNPLDVFYDVYDKFLVKSSEPQSLLSSIFKYSGSIGSNEVECTKVRSEVQALIEDKSSEVKKKVRDLALANDTTDVFYSKLWDEFFNQTNLKRGYEECAIMLNILNESVALLPYYQAVDLCRMGNEDYKKAVERIRLPIIEAIHMLNRDFEQKTERASQLYRIANTLSKEDAYVFWAAIIDVMEKSSYRAGYSQAKSEIKQKIESDIQGE